MNSLFSRAVLIIAMALVSGCATVIFTEEDRAAMGGRYDDVAAGTKGDAKDPQKASGAELVDLCIAYSKLKTYNKLFECLDRMEGLIGKGERLVRHHGMFSWNYPENVSLLPSLMRAEAQLDFGDYGKTVEYARAAYDRLPAFDWTPKDRTNSWERRYKIRSLGLMALAHALKGERQDAERVIAQIERVEPSSQEFWLTPGGINAAISKEKQLMLARANMALGRYEKVLALQADGWDSFGSFSEGLIMGYAIFAFVDLPKEFMKTKALYETGKVADATARYDSLLARPETRSNGDIYWAILFDRGRIAQSQGRTDEAIGFFRKAVDVIEGQRSSINTEASKIGFVGDKQAVYGRLISLLVDSNRVADALEYVERSKSRSLVDLLASKKEFAVRDEDQDTVRSALAELFAAELASRAQDGSIPIEPRDGTRNLNVARQQIRNAAPELSTLVSVSSIAPDEIARLIGPDETLIEYYYHGKQIYAFSVSGARLHAVKIDGDGLAEEVQAFRKELEKPVSDRWQSLARSLYRRLWLPLEPMVTTKRIVIVPHGVMHYVPFAALQRQDGAYLIDVASLRSLPSASVLKFLKPRVESKKLNLLAFGNPDLGDPALDLKFAEEEARIIAGGIPGARLLVRKGASETNFKKSGRLFNWIHFASHGKFNADSPLDSGLYLAADGDNDGILTVGELYSMAIDADLVTLSACETGLGRVANGDDVVGLSRGFLYAGSRSIVSSLWSVDDLATGSLMKAFYANLARTGKSDALREAQIRTRQEFPHAYYWAAFQLTGRSD